MAPVGIVSIEGHLFVEVDGHQIEVAIPVEIGIGGPVTHAVVVQTPGYANVLEIQIAVIAKGQVLLAPGRPVFVKFPHVAADHLVPVRALEIGVGGVSGRAVGYVGVRPPIVVKIGQLDGPCPIGFGQPSQVGDLHETVGPGVQIQGIAHVLGGPRIFDQKQLRRHCAHGGFFHEMGG